MLRASPVHQILDLARWAPSGDNTQPWQFEVLDDHRFVIHGRDTRTDCVYDLDGRPSQLSLGALIETIDIAASAFGLYTDAVRRTDMPDTNPTFDITLVAHSNRLCSDLASVIPARSVFRRAMRLRPVSEADRHALATAVGPGHELLWFEGWPERLRWSSLLWANAGLRLRLPEAFDVHRRVIQWHARFSIDRIPDQALGAGAGTLLMMRQAMTSWSRVNFLNTWLGGTIPPRLEMDLIPALACGAHIAIVAANPPQSIDDYVTGGRAIQRFWLTVAKLGLLHQPALTPLIFSRYVKEHRMFTEAPKLQEAAARVSRRLDEVLGERSGRALWLGRIGHGPSAMARSERKALSALIRA